MRLQKTIRRLTAWLLSAAMVLGGMPAALAEEVTTPDEAPALEETAAPEETEAPKATQAPAQAPEVTEVSGQLIVPAETATLEAAEAPEATKAPAQEAAMVGPMPPKKAEKVRGYVVLTVGGRQYGDPIPMDRDKIITLKQDDGKLNKVHITPETVYMEFSTCENQDCVGQGEVHVDTYKDRILGTYIICLPNNVSIEMVPADN